MQGCITRQAQIVVVLNRHHSLRIFLDTNRTPIIMTRTLATTTTEVPFTGELLMVRYRLVAAVEDSQHQVITDTSLLLRPTPFLV